MLQTEEQKRIEAETLAYKQFMKVAKRVSYLQYGKWKIVPSPVDPLRKFTLEKETEWFPIKISLMMERYYHRGIYGDNRYAYRAKLVTHGSFSSHTDAGFAELYHSIGMKLRPRMAKKLVKVVDEVIVPKVYMTIEADSQSRLLAKQESQAFINNVSKVQGLTIEANKNSYDRRMVGRLSGCPFDMSIDKEQVTLSGEFKYEDLALMAERMGWGV